ncbi:hypothetical protein C206_13014 [Pseudomonas putida TRO1]|uniref:Uncharacterized protein n=1 Tax=Pseudomonas putida TRO1 TaxID=1227924 RepID=A0AAD2WA44_PSEPU|nr:hypothetical protein L483_15705 [Pseudomonas putida H8234]ENY77257.1 hypothetical protein C206_13014 [Pseudomonas putida TRO1]
MASQLYKEMLSRLSNTAAADISHPAWELIMTEPIALLLIWQSLLGGIKAVSH